MEIYLATAENIQHSRVLHKLRYPFRLGSYFGLGKERPSEMLEHAADGSRWIMDSGLFSFMFGAKKGALTTYDDFKQYASTYVETMLAWEWKHCIVECDTQRLLGVEETHRLREEVFKPSGLEVMYVWHTPDGVDALPALTTENTRTALSVPEMRMLLGGGDNVKRAILKLLGHCTGPAAVHLLGNTETRLLALNASSSDSSSWIYPVSFGKGTIYDQNKLKQVSVYSPRWRAWVKWCIDLEPEVMAEANARDQWLFASAIAYRMMVPKTLGDDAWQL